MKLFDRIADCSVARALQNENGEKAPLPHHLPPKGAVNEKAMRRKYTVRLIIRTAVFLLCLMLYIWFPDTLATVSGFGFFEKFSPLHLLWIFWVFEILTPIFSAKGMISTGALKYAKRAYAPRGKIDGGKLFAYIKQANKGAFIVFLVWCAYMGLLVAGLCFDVLKDREFFLVAAFLNVVDLVFVLYYCPLRVWFMKNRCCTTCRIFNWDHILIYSAFVFVPGFFGYSLLALAIMELVIWEVCFFLHPERFWEGSNQNLRCASCSDKLCPNRKAGSKPKQTVKV